MVGLEPAILGPVDHENCSLTARARTYPISHFYPQVQYTYIKNIQARISCQVYDAMVHNEINKYMNDSCGHILCMLVWLVVVVFIVENTLRPIGKRSTPSPSRS